MGFGSESNYHTAPLIVTRYYAFPDRGQNTAHTVWLEIEYKIPETGEQSLGKRSTFFLEMLIKLQPEEAQSNEAAKSVPA